MGYFSKLFGQKTDHPAAAATPVEATAPKVAPVAAASPSKRTLGIDVSHYEPPVVWSKARAAGVEFMFTKASEGTGHKDATLHMHINAAKVAGVLVGAYHFFHASMDAVEQARNYLHAVDGLVLDLPHCLDWESGSADGQPAKVQIARAQVWLDIVEKQTGRTPIIYGGEAFLRELNLPTTFQRYPLWLAHYGVSEERVHTPAPWKQWTMWQYSESETVAGLSAGHHVDANWFRGSVDDLNAFAKG